MQQNDKKRITLQDIADRTGYSVNTVSHALRGKNDISQETTEQIRLVAREMGYTGNQIARSLRSGRTHTIAVILGNLTNPFYGIMADAIQDAAQAKGYTVMIMCSRDTPELELHVAGEAIARCVDGVLLFPSSASQETMNRLTDAHIPFVLLSRIPDGCTADSVVWDETGGACLATRHLIESGRRKLVYIAGNDIIYSARHRIEGFNKACDEAGIPETDRAFLITPDSASDSSWAEKTVQRLIELHAEGFNGLFIFCDMEAWHILDALNHSDKISQDDFGIVSIDNLEDALSFPLSLCSIGYSFKNIAEKSIHLLRKRIHGSTDAPQGIVLPVELICRGSCRKH